MHQETNLHDGPLIIIAIYTILIYGNPIMFTSMHKQSVKQQNDMFSIQRNKAFITRNRVF